MQWTDKYKPNNLSAIVSHSDILQYIRKCIKKNLLPNMLLHGPSGIGKTTIARNVITEYLGGNAPTMAIEINASEERGVDIIRNKILGFVSSSPILLSYEIDRDPLKIVILDEADSMTFDAQLALKSVMDAFSHSTCFIIICNYVKKIHYVLVSRCINLKMYALSLPELSDYICNICANEGMKIRTKAIKLLHDITCGDVRQILNILQSMHIAGYRDIKSQLLYGYLNRIPPSQTKCIIEIMHNEDMNGIVDYLRRTVINNGYSLHELLNNINKYLIANAEENSTNKYEVIRKLSKIEMEAHAGVKLDVLLANLSGIFK